LATRPLSVDERVVQLRIAKNSAELDEVEDRAAGDALRVRHGVVPSLVSVLNDREKQRVFCQFLFRPLRDERYITHLRRIYGEDFVVDESD
jgi:hypothetical protein